MDASIDIVIPSYRLDERYLLPMLHLSPPLNFKVSYYMVADNPTVQVPASIQELAVQQSNIHIIVNEVNLGFSKTRNKGIDSGTGSWILLLDDDVLPDENLLHAYAKEIELKSDAIGFIGITNFPPVMNAVTRALYITGVSTHFQKAQREPEMYWSATANIMLNRKLLGDRRFLPELTKSTEDMELLFRNASENNLQKYQSVPEAIVNHPWWDGGAVQTRRMFLYGEGAGEAAELYPIKQYTFYDFTNTTETLSLLTIALMVALLSALPAITICILIVSQIIAELLTNYYRSIKVGNTYNVAVAWQVTWHKNVMEAGRLWGNIKRGNLAGFAQRTDGSFRKSHPQNFRLNRWKIIKLVLNALITALLYLVIKF